MRNDDDDDDDIFRFHPGKIFGNDFLLLCLCLAKEKMKIIKKRFFQGLFLPSFPLFLEYSSFSFFRSSSFFVVVIFFFLSPGFVRSFFVYFHNRVSCFFSSLFSSSLLSFLLASFSTLFPPSPHPILSLSLSFPFLEFRVFPVH